MDNLHTLIDELKAEDAHLKEETARLKAERKSDPRMEQAMHRSHHLLESIAAYGPDAVEPLLAIVEDEEDSYARGIAIAILGRIKDPRAVETLLHLLQDEEDAAPFPFVVLALTEIGDSRAVAPLIEILEHAEERTVRDRKHRKAQFGQGIKGSFARVMWDIFGNRSESDYDEIHRVSYILFAVRALGTLGDRGAIAPLKKRENDADATIRQAVQKALAKLERAVPHP